MNACSASIQDGISHEYYHKQNQDLVPDHTGNILHAAHHRTDFSKENKSALRKKKEVALCAMPKVLGNATPQLLDRASKAGIIGQRS